MYQFKANIFEMKNVPGAWEIFQEIFQGIT